MAIVDLAVGKNIRNLHLLTDLKTSHWKYSHECDKIGGSFAAGSVFRIVQVGRNPTDLWVKVLIPGSDPARYLKISGGDYANNFTS